MLTWITISELNTDYFTIEISVDGDWFDILGNVNAAGSSNQQIVYTFIDYEVQPIINYYRLKQTDLDGSYKYFTMISIDNTPIPKPELIKLINVMGQEVGEEYKGLRISIYSDGTVEKISSY